MEVVGEHRSQRIATPRTETFPFLRTQEKGGDDGGGHVREGKSFMCHTCKDSVKQKLGSIALLLFLLGNLRSNLFQTCSPGNSVAERAKTHPVRCGPERSHPTRALLRLPTGGPCPATRCHPPGPEIHLEPKSVLFGWRSQTPWFGLTCSRTAAVQESQGRRRREGGGWIRGAHCPKAGKPPE